MFAVMSVAGLIYVGLLGWGLLSSKATGGVNRQRIPVERLTSPPHLAMSNGRTPRTSGMEHSWTL